MAGATLGTQVRTTSGTRVDATGIVSESSVQLTLHASIQAELLGAILHDPLNVHEKTCVTSMKRVAYRLEIGVQTVQFCAVAKCLARMGCACF